MRVNRVLDVPGEEAQANAGAGRRFDDIVRHRHQHQTCA